MSQHRPYLFALGSILIIIALTVFFLPIIRSMLTTNALTSRLEMGATELRVNNLDLMTEFYTDLVGLHQVGKNETTVILGYQDRRILQLAVAPELSLAAPGSAGLYHTAIVFASQPNLAQTLQRLLEKNPSSFQGSSDHIVSEAFYFTDPEGNGLELYFDKDPTGWQWQNGQVQMGSRYIDPSQYIAKHGSASADPTRKMGHVHLRVGDLEQAKSFYVSKLGLVVTNQGNGALFVSDGTYHHHFGLNVWESNGAGVRNPSLGLGSVEILVEKEADINSLQQRLNQANLAYERNDNKLQVDDPWGNTVIVRILGDS